MTLSTTEFKVGLFFFSVFGIVFWMISRVDDTPETSGGWKIHSVLFEDATGLLDKTPVETAGIRVGFIKAIDLEGAKARVTLALDPKVIIYQDASVTIRDRGILGEKYLNILPGTKSRGVLPDQDTIRNAESSSPMAKAFEKFESIAGYIESITANLDTILREDISREAIKTLLANLEVITQAVHKVVLSMDRTIVNSDRKFDSITTSLDILSKDLIELFHETTPKITRTMENVETISNQGSELVKTGSADLAAISERVRLIAEKVEGLVDRISEGKGTAGKLLSDEEIGLELTEAIRGVNEYLDRGRKLSTSIGYRGEFLGDEQEIQNIVQITLQPRPDKYFLLEFVDSPSFGDLKVTQTEWELEGSDEPTRLIERTSDDDLTFSLQFCKTLYDMTFRFGLLRSEGGIALDYHLLDKRLTLTFEAFDFTRTDRPHLRSLLTFNLYRQLLLAAGIDDLINSNSDKHMFYNAFLGLGLRFTDDDLKTVLTSLPTPSM
ncbi:MAG: hypothetical protein A2284_15995 [Deltaproteobacteria bacterium RIFOXYA12_FULL_61_11]|nr:MAG: hypothetical protein A2284_15995 [Deltaproteobacteria bacterium RIFOXYA12_FULL_61_11]